MKTPEMQILSMLQAFRREDVLSAIKLYNEGIENENKQAKKELMDGGWIPQKTKPEDLEFYFFGEEYWVQTDDAIEASRKKIAEEMQKRQQQQKQTQYKKQKKTTSMSLKQSGLKCPICGSAMYKQAVCPGCRDGKAGYKIRLLCEDNPDHEVLL